MPILEVTTSHIKQQCVNCSAVHLVPLKQGYSKSKKGPFVLADGDTLEVKVDRQATPQAVTFSAGDFADILAATEVEVAAKLNAALVDGVADVDEGAVRLTAQSTVMSTSAIEVAGGTARQKLGFDGRVYGPRCLGVTKGQPPHDRTSVDTIDMPHCPECQSKECLVRTWDACPSEHTDSFFGMHRACVNALAQYLKTEGYSEPGAAAAHAAESNDPPEIDMAFPPGPMTLPSIVDASTEEGGT